MSSFADGYGRNADRHAVPGRTAAGAAWRETLDVQALIRGVMILFVSAGLAVAVLCPLMQLLSRSLQDQQGNFAGLANFVRYFRTPALAVSLFNSLYVSIATTLISGLLGFLYAYALTRTCIPAKGFFRSILMMLLFSPTLLNGIALIYLFGKKGLITKGFFGVLPGVDIGIYGPVGIIIAEVIYTLPQAMLILSVALLMTDARLYEASASLGASRIRSFFSITIPSIRYAYISTFFVCFIMSFTDFGAPKVVGGQFNVLATDIYKQVVGQQNFVMGAVVSCILLVPTIIAFAADKICQHRQFATVSARSVPLIPEPQKMRDRLFLAYCIGITVLIGGYYLTALFASLVKVWPYDLTLGLQNFAFGRVGGGGWTALWNSVRMSVYSAVAGTALAFVSAYLIEKGRGMEGVRQGAYLLSLLPLALPGMVIGLSYIFFFNPASFTILGVTLPNPFRFMYATMSILVLSNVVHFYAVSLITATAALKQLDKEFEAVSESLGVPFYKTFLRVTAPVCLPAILEIAAYFFVNSMATVSAVIFLYSPDIPLASVAVANMDDAGDTAPACAMCILVVAINIVAQRAIHLLSRVVEKRTRRWMVR